MKLKLLTIITPIICTACVAGGDNLHNQSINIAIQMASATSKYFQEYGEDKTINAAKNALKKDLKDPESASFTNVQLRDYAGGKVVCGNINAKNSFGGYVGAKQFIASPFAGQIYINSEYAMLERAANAGLIEACN